MTRYRWVWKEDIQKWGLMIGNDSFPTGVVFEKQGQAYWLPFGNRVIGKQMAESIEAGKAALLHWLEGEGNKE